MFVAMRLSSNEICQRRKSGNRCSNLCQMCAFLNDLMLICAVRGQLRFSLFFALPPVILGSREAMTYVHLSLCSQLVLESLLAIVLP